MSVTKAGVTVTLALDEDAKPQLTVEKGGKPLKSIPPALKKDKKILELTGQAADLKRQAGRMRGLAGSGHVPRRRVHGRGTRPTLRAPHPGAATCAPGPGGRGHPGLSGKARQGPPRRRRQAGAGQAAGIAADPHPHDLLESKAWTEFQQECFRAERVQPFKQIFRECTS